MRRVGASVFALVAILALCGSASARISGLTSVGAPTLSLSDVTASGFAATLSGTGWYLDSCSGTATFPDGTVSLDSSLITGYESTGEVGYVSAPENEVPSAINISCQVEDDDAYLGMKTVWHNRRYIKAGARFWQKSASCNIGSHYYATLTIDCRNSGRGWVKWFVPMRKGDRLNSAWIQWNKFASTSRPFASYVHVKRGVVATLPVAAGRVIVVNNVSVVVAHRTKQPTYGTIHRTVGGPYTVNVPPCTSVSESYSGTDDLTEPTFTTCRAETLSWTWTNTNGAYPTGMYISDESQFATLVDSDAASGSLTLPAGTHTLDIITIGDWTITVG